MIRFRTFAHLLAILLIAATLGACATQQRTSPAPTCEQPLTIQKSFGDVIKLQYPYEQVEEARQTAHEWCRSRYKQERLSTENCSGCCVSVWRCFSE